MAKFRKFHTLYGDGNRAGEPPSRGEVSDFVSDLMKDEWEQYGLANFADGLIWFTNPADFASIVSAFTAGIYPPEEPAPAVVARTAFGDLVLVRPSDDGEKVSLVSVHYGRCSELGPSLRIFCNMMLTDSRYVEQGIKGDLTKVAVETLGPLQYDEMFTFVPALALGGDDTIDQVEKVKMMPQLEILSQLHETIRYQK